MAERWAGLSYKSGSDWAMSLRGRKDLPAGSSISSSAGPRGDAAWFRNRRQDEEVDGGNAFGMINRKARQPYCPGKRTQPNRYYRLAAATTCTTLSILKQNVHVLAFSRQST
jgi:hypothetical protein